MNKLRTLGTRIKPLADALQVGDSWRADKASSTARGYGYEWQLARAEYLRLNPWCIRCKRAGLYVAASVVDHVRPHLGDQVLFWDRNNWQGLCKHCHSQWKQAREHAQRSGATRTRS